MTIRTELDKLHTLRVGYTLGARCNSGLVYKYCNQNTNDMLACLLNIWCPVHRLVCVLWKVMRIIAVELWCNEIECALCKLCDMCSVAVRGSLKTFLIIPLVVY